MLGADTAAMFGDFWVDKCPATRFQPGQRAFFIAAHQAAIAGNVSCEDRRKTSVNPGCCHIFSSMVGDICATARAGICGAGSRYFAAVSKLNRKAHLSASVIAKSKPGYVI